MTDEIKALLAATDSKTLAQWWCQLNRYEWPEQLGEPEPIDAPRPRRRTQIMDYIMFIIGHKECLREWNKKSMPGNEFDEWYAIRSEIKARWISMKSRE